MENSENGPVRLWQKMQETDKYSDKHRVMEAERNNRIRKMRDPDMRRHKEQRTREGTKTTRATDDIHGPESEAKRRRKNRRYQQKRIQHQSWKELSDSRTGSGDHKSSDTRTRTGDKRKPGTNQTSEEKEDRRDNKRQRTYQNQQGPIALGSSDTVRRYMGKGTVLVKEVRTGEG